VRLSLTDFDPSILGNGYGGLRNSTMADSKNSVDI
jgi:hypothetical protein